MEDLENKGGFEMKIVDTKGFIQTDNLLSALEWAVAGYCDASILKKKEPETDVVMTSGVVPQEFDSLAEKALTTNSLRDWLKLRRAIKQEILKVKGGLNDKKDH